jgi:hypothetical protein
VITNPTVRACYQYNFATKGTGIRLVNQENINVNCKYQHDDRQCDEHRGDWVRRAVVFVRLAISLVAFTLAFPLALSLPLVAFAAFAWQWVVTSVANSAIHHERNEELDNSEAVLQVERKDLKQAKKEPA